MIVTATQIQIKGIAGFLRFFQHVLRIRMQLGKAEGLVFIKFNGLRTLTGWHSFEAMKAFRNSGHHLDAMRNVRKIGNAKSVTWEAQSEPDWHEAREKLASIAG